MRNVLFWIVIGLIVGFILIPVKKGDEERQVENKVEAMCDRLRSKNWDDITSWDNCNVKAWEP